jgi:hypothetical protein
MHPSRAWKVLAWAGAGSAAFSIAVRLALWATSFDAFHPVAYYWIVVVRGASVMGFLGLLAVLHERGRSSDEEGTRLLGSLALASGIVVAVFQFVVTYPQWTFHVPTMQPSVQTPNLGEVIGGGALNAAGVSSLTFVISSAYVAPRSLFLRLAACVAAAASLGHVVTAYPGWFSRGEGRSYEVLAAGEALGFATWALSLVYDAYVLVLAVAVARARRGSPSPRGPEERTESAA